MENLTVASIFGVVIAAVILSAFFSTMYNTANTLPIANETFSLNNTATHTLAHYPVVASSYTLYNTSAQALALTDNTHYNVTLATGVVAGKAGMAGALHTVSMAYSYEPTEYVQDAGARTLLNFMPLLLAVLIIFTVAAFVRQ